MTRPRTQAREAALKALYQLDLRPELRPDELEPLLREEVPLEEARGFARGLIEGVRAHQAEIDRELEAVAHNWTLRRMAAVDRNVLRIGAFELMFCREEIPAAVAIDEAVTIAKKFGARESGSFVNGLLDRVNQRQGGPAVPASSGDPAVAPGEGGPACP